MSIALIGSGLWFGYEFTTMIIGDKFDFLVRISTGIGLGMVIQSFVFFISSRYYPLTKKHGLIVCIIFYLISLLLNYFNNSYLFKLGKKKKKSKLYRIKYCKYDLFITLPCIIYAIWASYIVTLRKNTYARGPTYADLPFQMNIIASFAYGINYNRTSFFDVWSPFQQGVRLAYPMMHNLYIAAIINTDDSIMYIPIKLTGFLLTLSSMILLHAVFLEFSNDRFVAAISIPVWMTLGGLGYLTVYYNKLAYRNDVNWINRLGEEDFVYFMQPFCQIFLPQRSAAFAFPLTLTCLLCFFRISKNSNFPISYVILAAFCTTFLPQIQVHSYVAMAQYAIAICIICIPKTNFWKYFWKWALYGFISTIIGIPLTYPYWIRKKDGFSILSFGPIWKEENYSTKILPIITLWWQAIGPFAYVMLLFGWTTANQWQMKHWLSSMFVWLISSFLRYQPWVLDNIKVLCATWIPIAVPYVMQFYLILFRKAKNHKIIRIIIIILIVQNSFSGILNISLEIYKENYYSSIYEFEPGQWIQENSPINSTFMSFSSRYNPVTSFAGRQLFLGFVSWIAQHGVLGPNRELKQNELLSNKWNWTKWKEENVSYVLTKAKDPFVFPLGKKDSLFWQIMFQNEFYTIYKTVDENNEDVIRHLQEEKERQIEKMNEIPHQILTITPKKKKKAKFKQFKHKAEIDS